MQQQGSKAKTPQKKGAHFFFRKPLFLTNFFSKTLLLHHPLKIVHKKSPKNPIFIGSKKDGQVIDPTMAKLLTLKWPKNGQVIDPTAYTYIYILWSYQLGQVWGFSKLLIGPSLFLALFVKKHYKNKGFSTFFIKRKLRAQILKVINWAKLAFFWTPKLAQLITLTWPS